MRVRLLACLLIAGCVAPKPTAPTTLRLQRVILYQNGIGYFERSGQVAGDTLRFEFSRHEVDDVLKTLTVIDRLGGGVATVDVPEILDKDRKVRLEVRLSQGKAHDVQVGYAVPTPVWKAAYRVVLDDKTETPTGLLQGWAMINNVSQENWERVQLTLATGAPMSYALDLHSPAYVMRPDASGKLVSPTVLGPIENEKVGAAQNETGDRDHDRIANLDDLCPDDAEDKDGFEDDDGCPDPDNDKDRIPDKADRCPNEPETYNGFDDDDGCPDRGRVVVTDTSIEILDNIYFEQGKDIIRPSSFPILDAVAATLKGNPTITLIEMQGHAAANESDAWGLSSRRAAAVRGYLLRAGLTPKRLAMTPYGDTQPIDQAGTEAARAKNRRVSFLILKRSDGDEDAPAPKKRPPPIAIDPTTAAQGIHTSTNPVDVAGAVRYELGEPISVPHGGATMVSILNKSITAEDAFLFRPDANAPGSDRNPFRAVRLVNTSGYTLQPGPIAIFARGTFVGDSLVGRLDLDETSWIPYALDSSTTVTAKSKWAELGVKIASIHKGVVDVETASVKTTTYSIAVGRQPAKRIFIRHVKASGYQTKNLPPGTVDQGDAYLVPVPLVAARISELVIEEREPRQRTIQLLDAQASELAVYIDATKLPQGVAGQLKVVIDLRKDMATISDEVAATRERLTDVVQRAQEIRESIRSLDRVRGADDLRKKLVASLAQTTTESDALTKTLGAKSEALAAARGRLQDAIRDLVLEEARP